MHGLGRRVIHLCQLLSQRATSTSTLRRPYETKVSAMIKISQHQFERWSKQFSNLDLQIYRLALACKVDLGQTGMVDNVIANTALSGGKKDKPRFFTTMRGLLILRLLLQSKASSELGSHAASILARFQLDRMYAHAGRGSRAH